MDNIDEIVNKVIGNLFLKIPRKQEEIQKIWEKSFNSKGLEHTKIVEFKEGTLFVNVDSSAWLFQCNLKKKKIVEAIKKDIPEINKIYFKIGKIK